MKFRGYREKNAHGTSGSKEDKCTSVFTGVHIYVPLKTDIPQRKTTIVKVHMQKSSDFFFVTKIGRAKKKSVAARAMNQSVYLISNFKLFLFNLLHRASNPFMT